MLFRAGMVYKGVGDNERAVDYLERALDLNPRFSVLYADTAAQALEELRSTTRR
jgi:hypothetical protein